MAVAGTDFGLHDPVWVSGTGSASCLADRYRSDRVLLAGDAAHRLYPAGGMGLNVGVQDAWNLGWKLAATVRGGAPGWLLDSYHRERHPVGSAVLRLTGRQFRLNTARTTPRRLLRWAAYRLALPLPPVQYRLARTYSGVAVRYAPRNGDGHPLEGTRLPPGRLRGRDGAATPLYDLFSDGRFVLFARHPTVAPMGMPDQVRVVGYTASARPDWPAAVLVRPDGYVAWAADAAGAAPVRRAVRDWLGAD